MEISPSARSIPDRLLLSQLKAQVSALFTGRSPGPMLTYRSYAAPMFFVQYFCYGACVGNWHFSSRRDAARPAVVKGSAAEVIAFIGPAGGFPFGLLGNLAHNVASRLQLRHDADALSRPQRH